METKYVKVPFDVELAKKITNGEVEGRVVTRGGSKARILCFDRKGTQLPIIALIETKGGEEDFFSFYINGNYDMNEYSAKDLFLEIPEYLTYKDGDVVAFDGNQTFIGIFKSFDCKRNTFSSYATLQVDMLTFYETGWVINNFRLAKGEEIQKLIEALKASKEPKAKEYLKRFFGIEQKKKCEFKPFDKVLVRDGDRDKWKCDLFSHKTEFNSFQYMCVSDSYKYCIPYNEKTAHLLGTTEDYKGD